MKEYEPKDIEKKWQDIWEKDGIYHAKDDAEKKWYSLMEFPYPSGDGLHTGHVRGFTAMDVVSRKKRMEGYNVMYPIGWDAFGLPTENYAIKTGRDPKEVTKENTDTFRRQFKALGMSFDWSREVNTTDPKYYKWTQWIFLKFLEHGLAYKDKIAINWCPKDKIGLANEEVVNGKCERCGTPVERREKEQWMLAITKYADRLDKDLDEVDYPDRVKIQQRNWIGKSEGAEIDFATTTGDKVKVFTTRPDTIFGATYMVLAPEHELVSKWEPLLTNLDEIKSYQKQVLSKSEIDRQSEGKEKTGVELRGVRAINPATKEEIPIWIADYVLPHYGTGAIMAVPAHDERDYEFAKKFDLKIRQVIAPYFIDTNPGYLPKEDKTKINRDVVVVIVKHWKEDKYLCQKNTKYGWQVLVNGGVEEGESYEEAAKREVREETGYNNFKSVELVEGSEMYSYFWAPHKETNVLRRMKVVLIQLADDSKEEQTDLEKEIHVSQWLDYDQTKSYLLSSTQTFDTRYIKEALKFIGNDFEAYVDEGILVNSGEFTGRNSSGSIDEIIRFVGGEKKITYKLRDWVFSRQRYWGEPIPVVHCENCGIVPIPESELPLELPHVDNYQPTDTGESPLANITDWVNTKCPKCGGDAKRETDTMPNWAGSSWYFYRYTDPKDEKAFASKDKLEYWMPVDWYNGGMEHTTLHLLYSRFWNKFLFDIGLAPTNEPYKKRTSHGMILAEGGAKMSKSLGNVINPDSIVERFGADTLRVYEMFMGPFEQAIAWSDESLVGPRRFLERVWKLSQKERTETKSGAEMHKAVKSVSEDIENLGFNTAISSLMIYANALEKKAAVSKEEYETLLKLLAPFAPHIAEELWSDLKSDSDSDRGKSIHTESWPTFDPSKLMEGEVTLGIQINGKVRADIKVSREESEESIKEKVLGLPEVEKWLSGSKPKKIIVVPGRIVSIVM